MGGRGKAPEVDTFPTSMALAEQQTPQPPTCQSCGAKKGEIMHPHSTSPVMASTGGGGGLEKPLCWGLVPWSMSVPDCECPSPIPSPAPHLSALGVPLHCADPSGSIPPAPTPCQLTGRGLARGCRWGICSLAELYKGESSLCRPWLWGGQVGGICSPPWLSAPCGRRA